MKEGRSPSGIVAAAQVLCVERNDEHLQHIHDCDYSCILVVCATSTSIYSRSIRRSLVWNLEHAPRSTAY